MQKGGKKWFPLVPKLEPPCFSLRNVPKTILWPSSVLSCYPRYNSNTEFTYNIEQCFNGAMKRTPTHTQSPNPGLNDSFSLVTMHDHCREPTCSHISAIGLLTHPLTICAPLPTVTPLNVLSSQTRPPILSLASKIMTYDTMQLSKL